MDLRSKHEVEHGELLAAAEDVERAWGWGTPAGRERGKRRARLIAEGAHLGPGVYALEVGCGTGMFTEMFAQTGAQLVAVDISPDLLEKARTRGLPTTRVQFIQGCFEHCDVEGPFDAVIGSSVLHHLELASALSTIYALLKPAGLMSFAEPNLLNPQVFVERTFRRWFPYVSPDETAFVRCKLKGDLAGAGFEDIEVTPFDWLHPATPASMIGPVGAVGCLLERLPLVREFAGSLYVHARRPVG